MQCLVPVPSALPKRFLPLPRKPLAPVVRENGVWTYAALYPTDFFTRKAYAAALGEYYMRGGPHPVPICQ